MRDQDGIYVGAQTCKHFEGIDKYSTKTCCGGRIVRVAFVKCAIKGVVEAEPSCSASACQARQEGR
jgi:hypothetical protein